MNLRKSTIPARRTFAAVLSAAMLIPSVSFATSNDQNAAEELKAILTAQQEQSADSLLEETLGLSQLAKAASENGLQWHFTGGLLPETAELLGIPDSWSDTTCSLLARIDPKLKKYLFEAGLQHASDDLLDVSLYGDEDLLTVAIPQFYSGSLALRSGNFRQQYLKSGLSELLGKDASDDIPDLDLHFYPQTAASDDSLISELQSTITGLQDSVAVTKATDDGVDIYTATLRADQLTAFYRTLFRQLLAPMQALDDFSADDAEYLEAQLEEMLTMFQSVLPEEIPVQFEVSDQRLQRIHYELDLDVNTLKALADEYDDSYDDDYDYNDAYDDSYDDDYDYDDSYDDDYDYDDSYDDYDYDDAYDDSYDDDYDYDDTDDLYDSDHTGAAFGIHVNESVSELPEDIDTISCSYELSFANPENLSEGYNFFMNLGYGEAPSALMAVSLNYSQQQEAGTESAALSLSIDADGESVYSATPYVMQFDSASNELAAQFSITDSDTDETIALFFSGTFSDIEKGKCFRLDIDDLSLNNITATAEDMESLGITASLSVDAEPGDIVTPTDCRYLLEMDQNALMSLFMECSANAETWSQLYAPEPESEPESEASDILDGSSAVNTSVIGGARFSDRNIPGRKARVKTDIRYHS
ncbi:MAG: hypothetical protein V8S54_08480 [Lachnospiraceae bacterium]